MIIMSDFNEEVGIDPHGTMSSVLTAGGLVDVHVTRHGIEQEPATYACGNIHIILTVCLLLNVFNRTS
jgi:hypothetical protein